MTIHFYVLIVCIGIGVASGSPRAVCVARISVFALLRSTLGRSRLPGAISRGRCALLGRLSMSRVSFISSILTRERAHLPVSSESLSRNKRVQLGLLRRPSLDRIHIEQSLYEVYEDGSYVHLCRRRTFKCQCGPFSENQHRSTHPCQLRSES